MVKVKRYKRDTVNNPYSNEFFELSNFERTVGNLGIQVSPAEAIVVFPSGHHYSHEELKIMAETFAAAAKYAEEIIR